jgi:hypothetical protein
MELKNVLVCQHYGRYMKNFTISHLFFFFFGLWRGRAHRLQIAVTVFAHSNSGVVGSNPTRGVYSVFVLLCVSVAALRRPDPSSKESMCIGLRNWINGQGPKGCRARERKREIESVRPSLLNSEDSSSEEVSNHLAIQEIRRCLYKSKVHYFVH